MAGGGLLPASIYTGGASGNVSTNFYIPATNTSSAGAIEGVSVIASLSAPAPVPMQFNMPETIPSGQLKLRTLFWANATSGNALLTPSDGVTSPGSNIGATSMTTEPLITFASTAADIMYENKTNLTASPTSNQMLSVLVTFASTGGWTLAQAGVFQFSVVWE